MGLSRNWKFNQQNKKQIFALIIVSLIFSVASFIAGISLSFVLLLSTWILCVLYAFYSLEKKLILSVFLLTYFTFLIGSHFTYEYFNTGITYYISDSYYINSNLKIFIALLTLVFTYTVVRYSIKKLDSGSKNLHRNDRSERSDGYISSYYNYYDLKKIESIRISSKLIFYVTYLFWMLALLEVSAFVLKNGYVAYYTTFISDLPFAIRAAGALSPFCLFVYLAALPKKSDAAIPLLLYAVYAVVSLATGRRIESILILIFIVVYLVMRHFSSDGEKWISKKVVFAGLLLVPTGIAFLYSFHYLRVGTEGNAENFVEMLIGFFQQQGISSSVIRLTDNHKANLNPAAYYSFFGLTKWLRTNTVVRLFVRLPYNFSYLKPSVEFATLGNSLANSLSYIVLGDRYLNGLGLGSNYIAELYYDFGTSGIIIGNIIYGGIMAKFDDILSNPRNRIWSLAFVFAVGGSIVRAPRWNFDIIFTSMLDLGMWSAFAVIALTAYLLRYRPSEVQKKVRTVL